MRTSQNQSVFSAGIGFAAAAILCAALVSAGPLVSPAPAAAAPSVTVVRAATGSLTIPKGGTYKLGAKASAGTLSYKSSAAKVVTVNKKGKLKAKKPGSATVTVKASAASGTATKKVKVKVVNKKSYVNVSSLSLKASATSLEPGATTKLTVSYSPKKASNKNVVFTSSAPKVATVSAKGVVAAKADGKAKITAKSCANGKATASVTVTVEQAASDEGGWDGPVPSADGVSVKDSLAAYSWADLKAIANAIASSTSEPQALACAKAYTLCDSAGNLTGDTKDLVLADGTTCHVRVLGFWHDALADGSKAGITFECTDIVSSHVMNDASTVEGGWQASALRSWLNSDFLAQLPSDVSQHIVAVQKRTNNVGKLDDSKCNDTTCVTATSDKLWLLCMSEVYGVISTDVRNAPWSPKTYDAEGEQYQFYAERSTSLSNSSACVKAAVGNVSCEWWWLRTPRAFDSGRFHNITATGNWIEYANVAGGVSPAFCF